MMYIPFIVHLEEFAKVHDGKLSSVAIFFSVHTFM
jgi:hypothetical protein